MGVPDWGLRFPDSCHVRGERPGGSRTGERGPAPSSHQIEGWRELKRVILVSLGALVALCAVAVSVFVLRSGPSTRPGATAGGNIPATARASVTLLLSARGRQALTPELAALLPDGPMFPPGTTFVAAAGTWHQAGAYANVTGMLREPGRRTVGTEIGLVRRRGRWLVTFAASR